MVKRLLKISLNKLGYDLSRVESTDYELELYQKQFPEKSIREKRYYNIGAGSFRHPCWTNVDYISDWYDYNTENTKEGIVYDLFSLEPLPVESDMAELVYSSHVIAHVNDKAVQNLLNESYRILKTTGCIRIITTDIDLSYRAYKKNDRNYFFWTDQYSDEESYKSANLRKPLNKESTTQIFLEDFAAQASEIVLHRNENYLSDEEFKKLFETKSFEEAMNYCTSLCKVEVQRQFPFNRMNWFNETKLRRMLEIAGFKNIYRSGYGQSHSPIFRNVGFFDNVIPTVSLFMEARK